MEGSEMSSGDYFVADGSNHERRSGLKSPILLRQEIDPFQFMGQSDRSNSFPDVPPRRDHTALSQSHPPPSLQAEELLERIDDEQAVASELIEGSEAPSSVRHRSSSEYGPRQEQTALAEDQTDATEYGETGTIGNTDHFTPPDTEARYEEGVPLVSALGDQDSDIQVDKNNPLSSKEVEHLGESKPDHHDNWANEPSVDRPGDDPDGTPRNPQRILERKSTSQVLGALQLAPHEVSYTGASTASPLSPEFDPVGGTAKASSEQMSYPGTPEVGTIARSAEASNEQTGFPDILGFNIPGVPTEASNEQMGSWGTPENDVFESTAGVPKGEIVEDEAAGLDWVEEPPIANDEVAGHTSLFDENGQDLSAMWKAALDDEDFLEEDGENRPDASVESLDFFTGNQGGFMNEHQDDEIDRRQTTSRSLLHGSVQDHKMPAHGSFPPNSGHTPTEAPQSAMAATYNSTNASPPRSSTNALASNQTGPSSYVSLPQTGWPQSTPIPFATGGLSNSHSAQGLGQSSQQRVSNLMPSQRLSGQRPTMSTTQSFSDKSKGGYSSPYDLPMDVTRPRKRVGMQQSAAVFDNQDFSLSRQLPPRSSSFNVAQNSESMRSQPNLKDPPHVASTHSSFQLQASSRQQTTVKDKMPAADSRPKSSTGGFFEELPMTSNPRQLSGSGRYTPQPGHTTLPSAPPPPPPQAQARSVSQQIVPQRPAPTQPGLPRFSDSQITSPPQQLLPPERVSPYASSIADHPTSTPTPAGSVRYSPAPPQRTGPPGVAKYASPPVNGHSPGSNALSHQPRNSSPLAYHEKFPQGQAYNKSAGASIPSGERSFDSTPPRPESHIRNEQRPWTNGHEVRENGDIRNHSHMRHQRQHTDESQDVYSRPLHEHARSLDEQRQSNFMQDVSVEMKSHATTKDPGDLPAKDNAIVPPRRPRTQSPITALNGPSSLLNLQDAFQRPASVHDPTSSSVTSPNLAMSNAATQSRVDTTFQNLEYIVPTDGREADPLQRWRGYPIFVWGFGGSVITSFPKDTQRYTSGQVHPVVKRSPGEIKVGNIKDLFPLEDHLARFPGPLKTKSKKKETIAWLSMRIDEMGKGLQTMQRGVPSLEISKRDEDKIMLWKCLRILVENDGVLENNPNVSNAVRDVLTSDLNGEAGYPSSSSMSSGDIANFTHSNDFQIQPEVIDPEAVKQLRHALLHGEREKAIWLAVDKRLWAHAMLISSTLSQDIWKQVIQEFVRKEVRTFGDNTESLAALYEIFGGNCEESIDELVPPSARAGLQMVSKSSEAGPAKNALEGLDRWRETLSLILSNRSQDDGQAIASLGRLLLGYGRVEAAHICFMFSRLHSHFGGADDPQTSMTLLGLHHVHYQLDPAQLLESILLSEAYEFGLTLSSSSAINSVAPHMQAYKLYHAIILSESGCRTEAQQYCEAILSTIKSSTKPSSYYHHLLMGSLDDLSKRLHRSPKDGSSSWISKPSMEKVSGSFFAKFNSFIAGEDSDTGSTGSAREGNIEVGPFARVAGGTPTASRSPSNADLHGPYGTSDGLAMGNNQASAIAGSSKSSRYAPATNSIIPRSSLEQGLPSLDSNRPSSGSQPSFQETEGQSDALHDNYKPSPYQPYTNGIPNMQSSYIPFEEQTQHLNSSNFQPELDQVAQTPSVPASLPGSITSHPYQTSPSESAPRSEPIQAFGGYEPAQYITSSNTVQPNQVFLPPSQSSYAALESSYEAPTSSYEPPSSQSYHPEDFQNGNISPDETKPKKKPLMEDDFDDFTAEAPSSSTSKAQKDKSAEDDFKKAAAADAAKDEQQTDKKGWFGGWFGGKKDPSAGPGPIRAKLGEESSFYYDPDLKKWVNKKGGPSESSPTMRPPPPKGPPSRSVSNGTPSQSSRPPSSRQPAPSSSFEAHPQPSIATLKGLPGDALAKPPSLISHPSSTSISSLDPIHTALPPSGPPSTIGTPANADSPIALGGDGFPPMPLKGAPGGINSGPPSRPPTSMSNASSIDDLLGPPGTARKGAGTVKKAKKGRGYVDVMAK
ncbi:MAG: vesicle coat component [Sclerophora amabilis]|nr:MAG: vesicle coat component [Sclerophora amabilis]